MIRPFVPIALLEGALASLPAGVALLRLDTWDDPGSLRLLFANDAASRFLGVDLQAELDRPLRDIFPSLLESPLPAAYAEVARGGRALDLGDVPYGDERIREGLFAIRAYPLPDQSVGLLFEDVSARRQAEAERLEAIGGFADAAFEGLLLSDGGRVLLSNQAFADMTGYTREELVGMDVQTFVHEADRPAIADHIARQDTSPYRVRMRRKDGSFEKVEVRGQPFAHEGRTVRATAVREVLPAADALAALLLDAQRGSTKGPPQA